MLVFEEREKPEYPEKKKSLSEQGREPTTNSHICRSAPGAGIEPGPHWREASVLTLIHKRHDHQIIEIAATVI